MQQLLSKDIVMANPRGSSSISFRRLQSKQDDLKGTAFDAIHQFFTRVPSCKVVTVLFQSGLYFYIRSRQMAIKNVDVILKIKLSLSQTILITKKAL